MYLSDAQVLQVRDSLTALGVACAVCRSDALEVDRQLACDFDGHAYMRRPAARFPAEMLAVRAVCERCGHLMQFRPTKLGVVISAAPTRSVDVADHRG